MKKLDRSLGLGAVVAISISAMLGSGIFVLPGLAINLTGPSTWMAYLLSALCVLPAALSKSELATAMPTSGGTYVYLERTFGPFAGTVAGLGLWLSLLLKSSFALVGLAIGQDRQIGKDNQLLWHISEDLKNFKRITLGKTMVMGRKTFESIGRPLPGRKSVVISRNPDLKIEGAYVVSNLEEAKELVESFDENEMVIIGGGMIYELAIEMTNILYLTKVDYDGEADVFFPDYQKFEWTKKHSEKFDVTEKAPAWEFIELRK